MEVERGKILKCSIKFCKIVLSKIVKYEMVKCKIENVMLIEYCYKNVTCEVSNGKL